MNSYKDAPASIVTRDIGQVMEPTDNIYRSVSVISKRARQVSSKMKEELNAKLAEFASTIDNLEEVFENREQIEISKYYERMPKPTQIAAEEFLSGEVYFREMDQTTLDN